jgi:hypothetical protein
MKFLDQRKDEIVQCVRHRVDGVRRQPGDVSQVAVTYGNSGAARLSLCAPARTRRVCFQVLSDRKFTSQRHATIYSHCTVVYLYHEYLGDEAAVHMLGVVHHV